MSTEDTVRNIVRAYNDRDLDAVLALCHDDVHYHQNTRAECAPYRRDCRGKEAMVEALGEIAEHWEFRHFEIADLVVSGDCAASQNRIGLIRKSTGEEVDTMSALFWTVRDGRVAEIVEYYDTGLLAEKV